MARPAKYKFTKYPGNSVLAPLLPIRIINPETGKDLKTFGVFDTGADTSLCPGELAELLGHNLKSPKTSKGGMGGAGSSFDTYDHTMQLIIYRHDEKGKIYSESTVIQCAEKCPVFLLGRDVFANYKAEINFKRSWFSLEKLQS